MSFLFPFFSFIPLSRRSRPSLTARPCEACCWPLPGPGRPTAFLVSYTHTPHPLALSQRSASLLPRHAHRRHHGTSAFLQTRQERFSATCRFFVQISCCETCQMRQQRWSRPVVASLVNLINKYTVAPSFFCTMCAFIFGPRLLAIYQGA